MKKLFLGMGIFIAVQAQAEVNTQPTKLCRVEVCNKLERITLSPSKWLSDKWGESCFEVTMPQSEAVPGKVLTSESRWYQGSFNPTKKSVTRIKQVYECQE
ncbi:putative sialidase [Kosakonia phage Kc263]|uniref:Sialidase n=1 Tax=Kosakonia phage Kc263 TaxID=2863194 RepID=A0AAE7WHX0_9CAUD|nr:putative sialidase [Kosakonia phage Kc263]QYN79909.1 putative sialidase [Kosakonia phage Kc263]